jgi:glycosyltransferase involved in cell wall biosynthesis
LQTALAIVFLKTQGARYPEVASAKTVLTAHNLGFQGIFHQADWSLLDLDSHYFSPQFLEFYSAINFLKGALVCADKITTVSPSYAREIMSGEQGFGLQGILQQRAADVTGILNGVDYSEWNPAVDPFIATRYSENDLTGKRICKDKLQDKLGLPVKSAVPVFGIISRLTSQKGFDLIQKIFDRLMDRPLQLVLLGSGGGLFFLIRSHRISAAEQAPTQVAESDDGKPVAQVETAPIERKSISEKLTAYGSVVAQPGKTHFVAISFESRVQHILVSPGQLVKQGDTAPRASSSCIRPRARPRRPRKSWSTRWARRW